MSDGATLAIPRGFRASGIKAGLKASGALDMAVLAADQTVCGGGNLHDQPRVRRPGEVVPGGPPRGRHPRHRDQLGQCQCRDRGPGIGERPAHGRACRRPSGLPARAGPRRIDRHHRPPTPDGQDRGWDRHGRGRAFRQPGSISNRRGVDHDDRHASQDRVAAPDHRRPGCHAAGNRQRRRHDRPADGDDARFSADRRSTLGQRASGNPLRCRRAFV